MRVTKTIREYVEREINNKFADAIANADRQYREERAEVIKKVEDIVAAANAEAVHIASEAGFWDETPSYSARGNYIVSYNNYCIFNKEKNDQANEARARILKRKDKAIEDILLGLELGETTKDMLREAIDGVTVE